VQELHVERTLTRGLVGNIYLGKVVRVLPGMQSAFIDIGLERAAFLHVADIWHPRDGDKNGHLAIEKTLFEGQALMVQVIKDPIGTKGARLSTQVSIAGRTLSTCRRTAHRHLAAIEGEAEREALRARVQGLVPADERGGFIVRTIAEEASDEELGRRHRLPAQDLGDDPLQRHHLPAPSLLYQDLNLAQRVLRDFVNDATA
jgi:ribonuclease G